MRMFEYGLSAPPLQKHAILPAGRKTALSRIARRRTRLFLSTPRPREKIHYSHCLKLTYETLFYCLIFPKLFLPRSGQTALIREYILPALTDQIFLNSRDRTARRWYPYRRISKRRFINLKL